MVNVDNAIITRVSNALNTLVSGEKPGLQALSEGPTVPLSMGPFCVTRSNPTHQLTDPTKPNPLQVGKFGPDPTQPNTTNNRAYSLAVKYLTVGCNQILSSRALNSLT